MNRFPTTRRLPATPSAGTPARQGLSMRLKMFVALAGLALLYLAILGLALGRHRHAVEWSKSLNHRVVLPRADEARKQQVVHVEKLTVPPRPTPAVVELVAVSPRIYTVSGPSPETLEAARGLLSETVAGPGIVAEWDAGEGGKPSRELLPPTDGPP